MFKTIAANTLAQIASKVITASSTLIVTLIIAKSLGPQGYGDFIKIFVFVGYFYTFVDFGLNTIFVKQSPKNGQKTFRLLLGLRTTIALASIFSAILISQIMPFNPSTSIGMSPLVKTGIAIASLTILTQVFFQSANGFFQKKLKYHFATIASILSSLVILAVVAFSAAAGAGFFSYVSAYVFGSIVFAVCALAIIKKKFNQNPLPLYSLTQFKSLFSKALPIGLALIFNLVYFRIDVLILSFYRPSAEVGIYGFAYQFFETSLALPIFFANSLYPALLNLKIQNPLTYAKQTKIWFWLMLVVSLLITAALILIAFLIPIFDPGFSLSKNALIILAVGMPFFFVSALLWHLLIIENKQRYLWPVYLFGAFLNLTLNLIFIPDYGFIAASAITTISELTIVLMLAAAHFKKP